MHRRRKLTPTFVFIRSLARLKLIPLTIVFSVFLLVIKFADFVRGTEELSNMLLAGPAVAEEDAKPEEDVKEEKKKEEEDKAEAKKESKEEQAGKEEKKEEAGEEKSAEKSGDKEEDKDKKAAAEGEAKEKPDPKEAAEAETPKPKADEKRQFTPIEVDLLQSLAARRDELKKWEDDVRLKENLLDATELRINKKLEEMKTLQTDVKLLLDEYNKVEDEKITSLVKIYENMKPKDAAKIFDELEMPILLKVVDKMSERKAAPVIANMDPKKAKQLTVELAEQRKLMSASQGTIGGAN